MTVSISSLTDNVTTTNGVVTGDGVFDDLMEAVNSQLNNQYELGRITGNDYATVYLGAMQAVIQQAVTFALSVEKANAETALLDQKKVTEYAQTKVEKASITSAPASNSVLERQVNLYTEQAKGFKWNADQKYLDTLLRAWGININTAGVPSSAVEAFAAGATGAATTNINNVINDAKPT